MKKFLSVMISFTLVTSILASGAAVSSAEGVVTALPKIDSTAWQYNSDDNVYYQTGISYCESAIIPLTLHPLSCRSTRRAILLWLR